MKKFNYDLENELALIEREAGKAKAMIDDIQSSYHFDHTDFSSLPLTRFAVSGILSQALTQRTKLGLSDRTHKLEAFPEQMKMSGSRCRRPKAALNAYGERYHKQTVL